MADKPARSNNNRQTGAPTISDVAAAARCSPMTVSRVINGEVNVRDTTRERVMDAVRKLNYAPNRAARSLAGGEQLRIALLYANPSASYLSELLMGALEQASRSDIHLIVEQCEFAKDEFAVVQRLVDDGISGFILPSPLCDEIELLQLISRIGARAIAVGPGEEPTDHGSVRIDEYRAAFDMTKHILALGHRRVGFIIGNPRQTASAQRFAGYRDALESANIEVLDELIHQGQFSYRSGLEAAEKLMALSERPTAIFASNDDMAAATIAVAHRRNLDVPGDISVSGFDDTAMASTIWPPLTTIRQPIRAMAQKSIELLARELRARREGVRSRPENITLDYELVRRESDSEVQ